MLTYGIKILTKTMNTTVLYMEALSIELTLINSSNVSFNSLNLEQSSVY